MFSGMELKMGTASFKNIDIGYFKNFGGEIDQDSIGQIQYLLFDTGSSIFTLTASKEDALSTAAAKIEDSLTVWSWGKQITFYGVKATKEIKFGNKVINGSIIYYDEQRTFEPLYKAENIWGLTGNVFFLKNTVIIDYKNKLFGVL